MSKQNPRVKVFLCITLVVVLLLCFQVTVFATSQDTVLTINTALGTNNTGDEDVNSAESQAAVVLEPEWPWLPISVIHEPANGFNSVRRTYALPPDINPAVISTANFEMFGQRFTFAYVIQQQTADESSIDMRETVIIEAHSRNLNDILPYLQQEIWFERDGFAGTLVLDLQSIASEVAGMSQHTSTATRQRTYPNMSSADNSLIPRTITEGGITFHLSTVDWQGNSTSVIDGHPVASSFTAHATYTTQVTQTRTTGYIITAEYAGTLFRNVQGKTLYTAVFYGELIIEILPVYPEQDVIEEISIEQEEEPAPELAQLVADNSAGNAIVIALAVLATIAGLVAVGAGGFILAKHFLGYNVTVYSINGPREIVKAGKIKMDVNSPEPTIILDKAVSRNLAKTDRYIVQVLQRVVPKLINKVVRVVLHDKEAFHKVPENAVGMSLYEFEVNFSDDDEPAGVADAGEYPAGGDAIES